jgi:hypothetical protein
MHTRHPSSIPFTSRVRFPRLPGFSRDPIRRLCPRALSVPGRSEVGGRLDRRPRARFEGETRRSGPVLLVDFCKPDATHGHARSSIRPSPARTSGKCGAFPRSWHRPGFPGCAFARVPRERTGCPARSLHTEKRLPCDERRASLAGRYDAPLGDASHAGAASHRRARPAFRRRGVGGIVPSFSVIPRSPCGERPRPGTPGYATPVSPERGSPRRRGPPCGEPSACCVSREGPAKDGARNHPRRVPLL